MSEFDKLELSAPDAVKLVSAVLGMSVYTEAPLSSAASGVLDLYERALSMLDQGQLRFYATETMRSHKPVAKSTWTMLPTWLKPDAPEREYLALQLKDGEQHQDAPHRKFQVYGYEPKNKLFKSGRANVVSASFPISLASADLAAFKALFVHACSVLPMRSGHAGLALECSRYEAEDSETHAWAIGMRMRGLDISRIPLDCQAVGVDGLKGVGWLTALGHPLIEQLGGLPALRKGWPKDITVIETPHGVVIQAGEQPQLGDVNRGDSLALYRAVYKKVAPLIDTAAKRSMAFNLAEDYVEKTEQWFMRLGDA